MGGLVTSHGAGMSVPDWPNSFGYNMFALPFSQWVGKYAGGVFYEHAHRLLGSLAGLLAVTVAFIAWGPATRHFWQRMLGNAAIITTTLGAGTTAATIGIYKLGLIPYETTKLATHFVSGFFSLAIVFAIAWRCRSADRRLGVKIASLVLLIAIILQGLMGGFRVTEVSLLLAKLHGGFGQLVFAGAGVMSVISSRWWIETETPGQNERRRGRLVVIGSIVVVGMVMTQLTLGALMRHDPTRNALTGNGAGLAIPDWPSHYGNVMPPLSQADLTRANQIRIFNYDPPLPMVTLGQIHLHAAHRAGAYLTTALAIGLLFLVVKRLRHDPAILWTTLGLIALVATQVTLGVLTVLWRKPADIATAHQATGALLLLSSFVLMTVALRRFVFVPRRIELTVRNFVLEPAAVHQSSSGDLSFPTSASVGAGTLLIEKGQAKSPTRKVELGVFD